ncbi:MULTISPECIES: hypothetical protein [unclassified Facklamia]|uniref:hypothetical protein n=1 Tax=Aerococcaceae TaxID=186827 RepID=UPI0013B7C63E|nr:MULTISPECIES: hypothetical protein [unclassified Facklamia]NEW63863.1 hypothetical protein [Facklamia sp. 252]NEW67334.1 hypothetical protein [Facklamia sp. 253]QQD65211.1 hypothetical protein JDW14_07920 [Aerococcaceae bacterium zg-252]
MRNKRFNLLKQYLQDNIFSFKYLAAILFVLSYLMPLLLQLNNASTTVGLRMHFAGIFFLLVDSWNGMVFFLGYLIVISNIPFKQNIQKQVLIRMGKLRWLFNQIAYLICTAIIYFVTVIGLMAIILFNSIGFFSNWGKFLGGLSRADGSLSQIVPYSFWVSPKVIEAYSPMQYLLIASLTIISILILFGFIVFVGNLYVNFLGFLLGGILLFFGIFAYASQGFFLYYASPLTWIAIHIIALDNYSKYPTWCYVIVFIVTGIVLMLGATLYKGKSNGNFDY